VGAIRTIGRDREERGLLDLRQLSGRRSPYKEGGAGKTVENPTPHDEKACSGHSSIVV